MSSVKVYIKTEGQSDAQALSVDIEQSSDVEALKVAYLKKAGSSVPLVDLVLKLGVTTLDNRNEYRSYGFPDKVTLTASHQAPQNPPANPNSNNTAPGSQGMRVVLCFASLTLGVLMIVCLPFRGTWEQEWNNDRA
jgi:hypothetical protein